MSDGWKIEKNHPEYDQYIHSTTWRKKAEERLVMDNHVCCVCGCKATEVHHLTYANFRDEKQDELVSLCHKCHVKAEEIYDSKIFPWAMEEIKPEGNNFMAAMRVEARTLAPVVSQYLMSANKGFSGLLRLRQPCDSDKRKYWQVLKKAVNALCQKRYALSCSEDRMNMMLSTVTCHTAAVCLAEIEHFTRNEIQKELHGMVMTEYEKCRKWKDVASNLGVTNGTLTTIRKDEGVSFGPSLREIVLYYCGMDAAAGIPPIKGFACLTQNDYFRLDEMADYMVSVSGSGAFKGEYTNTI